MFETGGSIRMLDEANAGLGAAHLAVLHAIAEADRRDAWVDQGARDLAHWLSMRYDIASWKARRWINAAHVLPRLPMLARALSTGRLGIDKLVELTRFATPSDEARLLQWAEGVSARAIRRRADVVTREFQEDAERAVADRRLDWWYTDQGRFAIEGELPGEHGAVIAETLDRLADQVPVMPGEEDPIHRDARRADALLALCSGGLQEDPRPADATLVVHARLQDLRAGGGGEVQSGPAVGRSVVERLACDARMQLVVEDATGDPIRVATARRIAPPWLVRQIRHRDGGCRFPGCGSQAFTHVHHVRWWSQGGRTDAKNLIQVCGFHHRLVHEAGWSVRLDRDGSARWFHPRGTPHVARAPAGAIAKAG